VKDAILKHIELNETYHEVKERLAWLASVFYVSFSIASIEQFHKLGNYKPGLTLLFLLTVYLAGLGYTSFQFRHRWQSVYTAYALKDMLKDCNNDDPISLFMVKYDEAIKCKKQLKVNKRKAFLLAILTITFPLMGSFYLLYRICGGRKDLIDSRYNSEIPSYAISFYTFIAQVIFIYYSYGR
jgi:hypothetical protein